MDALMAALVLGAICQVGDRTPWLAAILADRFRAPGLAIVAAAIALALNYALGSAAGVFLAPMLSPNARLVLLALALILAGIGTPYRAKSPDRLDRWRIGAVATSIVGLTIMAFGDRMQFVTAALAVRSPVPWLAAVGATIGALVVATTAILLGEARWIALPHRAIRLITAALLIVTGVIVGLNGLALV